MARITTRGIDNRKIVVTYRNLRWLRDFLAQSYVTVHEGVEYHLKWHRYPRGVGKKGWYLTGGEFKDHWCGPELTNAADEADDLITEEEEDNDGQ